ncbi:hypothetical protein RCL1_004813 [Eukaryota sp. TZLM3-RCL]
MDPKIVEIYQDYIIDSTIEYVDDLRKHFKIFRMVVEDQSNFIGVQNYEINTLKSAVAEQSLKISSQNTLNQQQSSMIGNYESEVSLFYDKNSALESRISFQNSAFSTQLSEINVLKSTVSNQSILSDQFKIMLPCISHIKAAEIDQELREKSRLELEQKRIEEEERRLTELERNRSKFLASNMLFMFTLSSWLQYQ